MQNSLIYHGGGQFRSTFAYGFSQIQNLDFDTYSYCFGAEGNIGVNSFINPPSDGTAYLSGTGYFTGQPLTFLSMDVVIHELRTNDSSGQYQVAIRYVTSVAGPVALTTAVQGTLLARKLFILPNTGNVVWYNEGGRGVRFADVPASSIIYCVVEARNALYLHGTTCIARFKEQF